MHPPPHCMSFYSLHRLELLHKMLGGRNDMGGEGVWLVDMCSQNVQKQEKIITYPRSIETRHGYSLLCA